MCVCVCMCDFLLYLFQYEEKTRSLDIHIGRKTSFGNAFLSSPLLGSFSVFLNFSDCHCFVSISIAFQFTAADTPSYMGKLTPEF